MFTPERLHNELNKLIGDLELSVKKNHILIKAMDQSGFDINIHLDSIESMIYFGAGGNHVHFDHSQGSDEDLIWMLVSALIGNTRIIEYSWNGKTRRYQIEEKELGEEWRISSTLVFPHWMFWRKKTEIEEVIKQNRYQLKTVESSTN